MACEDGNRSSDVTNLKSTKFHGVLISLLRLIPFLPVSTTCCVARTDARGGAFSFEWFSADFAQASAAIFSERRCSDALINEITIGRRFEIDADPEQRVEGAAHVSPPVPAEHELIEVALQMGFPEAVKHALRPSFHVGEHAMHPMQDLVGASAGDDLGLMRVRGRVLVAKPAVRDDMRARLDGPADEAVQRLRRPVGDVFHADTARLPVGG